MIRTATRTHLLSLLVLSLLSYCAFCAPVTPELMFRAPDVVSLRISPDGKSLAGLAIEKERVRLIVIDPAAGTIKQLPAAKKIDVTSVSWGSSERLIFAAGREGRSIALMGSNADGSDAAMLFPGDSLYQTHRPLGLTLYVKGRSRLHKGEALVYANVWSDDSFDLFRLDVGTGKATPITDHGPRHAFFWVLDGEEKPRAALVSRNHQLIAFYRPASGEEWIELGQYDELGPRMYPLAVDSDNKTLIVASNIDRDKFALYRYDPASKRFKDLIYEDPDYDVLQASYSGAVNNPLVFAPTDQRVIGARYFATRKKTHWLDARYRALQASIDDALPGQHNDILESDDDETRFLISSYSDRRTPTYYLLDSQTRKMPKILDTRPWLSEIPAVGSTPVRIAVEAGMTIDGFLTLPAGGSSKPHPLIVMLPKDLNWVFVWDFDLRAQFLAAQGYAVLQLNPRGVPTRGQKFYQAAFESNDPTPLADLRASVKWAIEQGVADKDRVCAWGEGFAGYLALMGAAKEPQRYRCAVAVDPWLNALLWYDRRDFSGRHVFPDLNDFIDQIGAPLFIGYSGVDSSRRVQDLDHMVEKLGKHNKRVEHAFYPAPKYWNDEDPDANLNAVDFYRRVQSFLSSVMQVPEGGTEVQ